jgi:hypothetical protein
MRVDHTSNSSGSDPAGGVNRAKAGMHELEAKMRRQVNAVTKRISSSFHHEEGEEIPAPKERRGIVSINGEDVETIRCSGGKRHS